MYLVQNVLGTWNICPYWAGDGGYVAFDEDEGRVVVKKWRKCILDKDVLAKARKMLKQLGLSGTLGTPSERLDAIPEIPNLVDAFVMSFVPTKPVPVIVGGAVVDTPPLSCGWVGFAMDFPISVILDVFEGRSMSGLLIKFLTPFNPFLTDREETRKQLCEHLSVAIKGFSRYKSARSWASKLPPTQESVKVDRGRR